MMGQLTSFARPSTPRRLARWAAIVVGVALVAAACSDSDNSSTTTTAGTSRTTEDPVAAAEARLETAQAGVKTANDALTSAGKQFCTDAETYVATLDRYGKVLTDSQATVGDVKTGGADLAAPRESVSSAATAVSTAQANVATANKELADAQAALDAAKATASSVPPSSTTPASTTTTTLVPPATINRVKQAENDLAQTSAGITDATPLVQATANYNSAAFALEIAWLQLLSAAGCLTDEQQAQAVTQVTAYTTSLQTELQQLGYYKDPVDGVYGPQTVAAVKQFQTDSGLPATGYVDQATAAALDKKLAALSQQQTAQAMTQTAALQTVLKLAGYWTGPIDGDLDAGADRRPAEVPDGARRRADRCRRRRHHGRLPTGPHRPEDAADHDDRADDGAAADSGHRHRRRRPRRRRPRCRPRRWRRSRRRRPRSRQPARPDRAPSEHRLSEGAGGSWSSRVRIRTAGDQLR